LGGAHKNGSIGKVGKKALAKAEASEPPPFDSFKGETKTTNKTWAQVVPELKKKNRAR